jgi:hypothetical protein
MRLRIFSFFFFLFVFCSLSSLASASLQLDKGTLIFNIGLNEEACKTVRVSSGSYVGEVQVRDIWAGTPDESRNFRAYTFDAGDHGLSISYTKPISDFQSFFDEEICLRGEKVGDYKGALIFTPESSSQVNVEIGTWLLVHISENPQEWSEEQISVFSSGGGSNRQNTQISELKAENAANEAKDNFDPLTYSPDQEDKTVPVAGTIISEGSGSLFNEKIIGIIIIIFIVAVAAAAFFIQRRRMERNPWLDSRY